MSSVEKERKPRGHRNFMGNPTTGFAERRNILWLWKVLQQFHRQRSGSHHFAIFCIANLDKNGQELKSSNINIKSRFLFAFIFFPRTIFLVQHFIVYLWTFLLSSSFYFKKVSPCRRRSLELTSHRWRVTNVQTLLVTWRHRRATQTK